MSRIGKMPVVVPSGVEVAVSAENLVTVKGKLGALTLPVDPAITISKNGSEVVVSRNSDEKQIRAKHGLYRALINNMVIGVSNGYEKKLEVIGVGYRANMNGNLLELSLGHSHPYFFVCPAGITIEVDTKTAKNARIIIRGASKELVGQIAAKIRSLRPPEPYKGKGVRYVDEQVRRKAGKSAGK
jgi:large subunit ribosomal protein L6